MAVVEASNGIQAWKVLEDLNNHIDIVLTEVIMPYLSGISLLSKILSHKSRRNIPVISEFFVLSRSSFSLVVVHNIELFLLKLHNLLSLL